ncbi:DnaJ-class molecular chaperone [Catenulispora sp. MAP12-49]
MSSVPRNEHQHTKDPRETIGPNNEPCESCRGRGWKHVTSRLAIVHEVIDDAADISDKQPCGLCSGTGFAA